MKVELRVAKILEAEAVPKSKKLIKMKVDAGEPEARTIVAGIAEAYQPDQLVGRTIVIVANLKPAKLMGIESNGMVLAGSPEGGLPNLVAVDPSLPAEQRFRYAKRALQRAVRLSPQPIYARALADLESHRRSRAMVIEQAEATAHNFELYHRSNGPALSSFTH